MARAAFPGHMGAPGGPRFYGGTRGNDITAKDYNTMVQPFFGPMAGPIEFDTSTRYPHEAFFLSDAYEGRNDYVRQTIVYAVVNQNSFMTKYILPWKHQDNPNIAWNVMNMNQTLAEVPPPGATPRYVTTDMTKKGSRMTRRALALHVNDYHGFASRRSGRLGVENRYDCKLYARNV